MALVDQVQALDNIIYSWHWEPAINVKYPGFIPGPEVTGGFKYYVTSANLTEVQVAKVEDASEWLQDLVDWCDSMGEPVKFYQKEFNLSKTLRLSNTTKATFEQCIFHSTADPAIFITYTGTVIPLLIMHSFINKKLILPGGIHPDVVYGPKETPADSN